MFEELRKVSSKEDTHAYITGIAEHDPSRLFDKRDAINAANWANEMCKHGKHCKEKDFPKLFQLSYQWIYDTGASRHFTGKKRAGKFKDHLQTIRASKVTTASGTVKMDQQISVSIELLDGIIEYIY